MQYRRTDPKISSELDATRVISAWLDQLKAVNSDKGMKLSDFAIMTDPAADVATLMREQGINEHTIANETAKMFGANTEGVTLFGQMYITTTGDTFNLTLGGLNNGAGVAGSLPPDIVAGKLVMTRMMLSDAAKYGGSILRHEREHKRGKGEKDAYKEQRKVFDRMVGRSPLSNNRILQFYHDRMALGEALTGN